MSTRTPTCMSVYTLLSNPFLGRRGMLKIHAKRRYRSDSFEQRVMEIPITIDSLRYEAVRGDQ